MKKGILFFLFNFFGQFFCSICYNFLVKKVKIYLCGIKKVQDNKKLSNLINKLETCV